MQTAVKKEIDRRKQLRDMITSKLKPSEKLESITPAGLRRQWKEGRALKPVKEAQSSASQRWDQSALNDLKNYTPATDKWFNEKNYAVAENSGNGMNCLLLALLQQATGEFDVEHKELAQEIRDELVRNHQIQQEAMLEAFPGDPVFEDAVRLINEKLESQSQLDPVIVYPTESGHPEKAANEPINIGSVKDLIVYGRNGLMHYEAVREMPASS